MPGPGQQPSTPPGLVGETPGPAWEPLGGGLSTRALTPVGFPGSAQAPWPGWQGLGSGSTRPKVSAGPQARRALLQSTEPHEALSRNPPAPSLSVVNRSFVGSEGRTLAQDVSQHSCLDPWTLPYCHFMSSDCHYQALPEAFHTCDCRSLQ